MGSALRLTLVVLLCVCSVGGIEKQQHQGGHAGDVHTYREDGWVVKNARSTLERQQGLEISAAGFERTAFLLLEMGQDALAQRALAASARFVSVISCGPFLH
jgi:hypothetical protein